MLCAKYDYKMDIAVKQEEAFENGMEAKALEAAKNLFQMNMGTPEQIAQATGLSLEQVLKLQSECQTT